MFPFIKSINVQNFQPILEKHGLANIEPDAWYHIDDCLALLQDISEDGNAMADFVSIGMKIAETAVFPPEFSQLSYKQIMQTWNDAYHFNNKGSDTGDILYEEVSDKHIKMIHRTPFPDDYLYGGMYGAARRFLPPGSRMTVYYDETETRRDLGGDLTIVHIEWD